MDKDYQEYKDFDMSGATRGVPVQIARLQAIQSEPSSDIHLIEPDVWQLIRQHAQNPVQIAKINGVLRTMLA